MRLHPFSFHKIIKSVKSMFCCAKATFFLNLKQRPNWANQNNTPFKIVPLEKESEVLILTFSLVQNRIMFSYYLYFCRLFVRLYLLSLRQTWCIWCGDYACWCTGRNQYFFGRFRSHRKFEISRRFFDFQSFRKCHRRRS